MSDKTKQLIVETAATLLVMAAYYLSTVPEWQLKMYRAWVMEKLSHARGPLDKTPLRIRLEIEKFRREISEWEHNNAREGNH
jgi:hypothetical protein